jgi:diketogulonate reductase-like aldo/keto reductase
MIDRREFLGITAAAGASLALTPELLRAFEQASGTLIQRIIPSTGEKLPVIGVQFRNSEQDPAALKAVLKTLVDNGGKFLDTMHQSVPGVEDQTASIVTELGIQNKLFLGLRALPSGPPTPGADTPRAKAEALLAKFKVSKIDLLQLPVQADPAQWATMRELKKQGRIRYISATTIVDEGYPRLEELMRNEPIDFIGVHFGIDKRSAEEKILPLAQERKIGVIAYFPFGVGALFQRAGDKPLPEWAAEFDAKAWSQFFLKYVVSHPAVTVVRAGTIQSKHMLENIGGGIGRLPDAATRKKMAALIDSWPGGRGAGPGPGPGGPPPGPVAVVPVAVLERYVGEYKAASGFTAIIRRDGDKLFVKPGNNPEAPLIPRSETRFQDPRGPFFEFQVDAQGKVTGAVLEQQGPQGVQKIPLERK